MHYTAYAATPHTPISPADIEALFLKTFSDSEGMEEGRLIADLAHHLLTDTPPQDLRVFIASQNEHLTACLIFSRLTFDAPVQAFLLAPVAVHSDFQKQGIGQGLIRFALDALRAQDVELVLTYGDSRFYGKVGFKPVSTTLIPAPFPLSYPPGWLAQALNGKAPVPLPGNASCVSALNNPAYW